jgi:uncharacterized protein
MTRLAVLSDTHSRYRTVEAALALVRARGAELILHCGDIEDAATVRLFQGFPTHFVFGNCDHDRRKLERAMEETGAVSHGGWGFLELDGRNLAWTHGDDQTLFHDLGRGGQFDYLFYGHTHQAEQHRSGRTLVVNPGALHRARVKTFVVLDLATGELESVAVE